jgi:ribonuclease PH
LRHAEGSALIQAGNTKVLCAASVEDTVPPFLVEKAQGWVTAEYGMLPRATHSRSRRERGTNLGGRTQEIQRLIGRSLRSIVDLPALGPRTVTVDCDVLQADGGTRVASISGAYVALRQALEALTDSGTLPVLPVTESVAAVSVGIVEGRMLVDLDYAEDSTADVDMNLVVTGSGNIVEAQATAEGAPFSLEQMNALIRLGMEAAQLVTRVQQAALPADEHMVPGIA